MRVAVLSIVALSMSLISSQLRAEDDESAPPPDANQLDLSPHPEQQSQVERALRDPQTPQPQSNQNPKQFDSLQMNQNWSVAPMEVPDGVQNGQVKPGDGVGLSVKRTTP